MADADTPDLDTLSVQGKLTVPTPLYVTLDPDNQKRVILGFNTVEEAELAWRLLSQMASDHADMIEAQRTANAFGTNQKIIEHDKTK